MSGEALPSKEELQQRWEVLWAGREELSARYERIIDSLATVEEPIGKKALAQLEADQERHKRELEELKKDMDRVGGFE